MPSLCPGRKLTGKIVTISDFCHKVMVTISIFYCIYTSVADRVKGVA